MPLRQNRVMYNIEIFLKGLLVGLLVSAPMGPIGVLCVQKTINKGRFMGFFSGLGAATADTTYAVLAAFGVTYITNFMNQNRLVFQIVGIAILLFLGFRMLMKNPINQYRYYRTGAKRTNAISDYVSVFFLTVSNPLTIVFFGAAFSRLGLMSEEATFYNGLSLVWGVFTGAVIWWFTLTYLVDIFRKHFRLRGILWLNRISGIVIIVLSVALGIKFFFLTPAV